MTKVAIYGFIRIAFDLNGPSAWWWSVLLIVLAGITCVLGVLSALMQHDLKRLLAYHTVENIGIIFLGLGLALAFSSHGLPAPAALALTVPCSTFSITAYSRPCCSLALARCSPPRASAIWSTSAA